MNAPVGWAALVDELLIGIGHTLNNRVAGVQAVHSLLGDGADPALLHALAHEADRLATVTRLLRAIPRRPHASSGPLILLDAVRTAAALLTEHDALRYLPVKLEPHLATPPVLANETALVHALLLPMAAAGRAAITLQGGAVVVTMEPDGEHVAVIVETQGTTTARTPPVAWLHREDAEMLAAAAGAVLGEIEEGDATQVRYVLRIPALQRRPDET